MKDDLHLCQHMISWRMMLTLCSKVYDVQFEIQHCKNSQTYLKAFFSTEIIVKRNGCIDKFLYSQCVISDQLQAIYTSVI